MKPKPKDADEKPLTDYCDCGKYLGHKGFCSQKCHDAYYDAQTAGKRQTTNKLLKSTKLVVGEKRDEVSDLIADWLQANGLRLEERPSTGDLEDLEKRIHEFKDTEAQKTIVRQQKELEEFIGNCMAKDVFIEDLKAKNSELTIQLAEAKGGEQQAWECADIFSKREKDTNLKMALKLHNSALFRKALAEN